MYNVYIVHMPCFCNPTLRQGKTRAVPVGCWREHPSRGQEETALSGCLRGLSAQLVGELVNYINYINYYHANIGDVAVVII